MATRDIKVRLTPEGLADVINALRKVQGEAKQASRNATANLAGLRKELASLKGLVPALGLATAAAGALALGRSELRAAKDTANLAEAVGSTTERISILGTAFQRGGESSEGMGQALTTLARRLGDLNVGSQTAVDTFAKLGLAAHDFAGKDTVEAFTLVAERMGQLPASAEKADLAFELFGKHGQALIGILNDVAARGFATVAAEAEAAGRIISSDTAAAAKAADEALRNLTGAAQGVANQFIAGLAPAIAASMQSVERETRGRGVAAIRDWGRETGRVVLTVLQTFKTFFVALGDLISGAGRQLGGLGSIFAALTSREFREAGRIWKAMGEDGDRDFQKFLDNFKSNLQAIARTATTDAPRIELPIEPTVDEAAMRRLRAVTAEIQGREAAKRAAAEAERAAKARFEAEKRASAAIFEFDQKLLELRGQGREAQLRALDAEVAKYRELFQAAGMLTDELLAKLGQFREISTVRIDVDAASADAEGKLAAFNRDAEQIRRDQEAGLTTQLEGENRLIELERQRVPVLQAAANEMLRLVRLSNDPSLIANAEQFAASVGTIAASFHAATNTAARYRQGLEDGLQSAFVNLATNIDQIHSLEDAFRSLVRTVAQAMAQIAAEILAKQAVIAILRALGGAGGGTGPVATGQTGGSVKRMETGGDVRGKALPIPGPDKIPALLQEGEYVVRRRVAQDPVIARWLRGINSGAITRDMLNLVPRIPRFAAGGPVSLASIEGGQSASRVAGARFEGAIALEEGLVFRQLNSDGFDDLQVYRMSRNPAKFRSALGL